MDLRSLELLPGINDRETCTKRNQSKVLRPIQILHGFVTCTFAIINLVCSPKVGITFVFHFFWILQSSKEKLCLKGKQDAVGRCASGELSTETLQSIGLSSIAIRSFPSQFGFKILYVLCAFLLKIQTFI